MAGAMPRPWSRSAEMASARDWADAFLAQARDDLKAAEIISGHVPSAFGMLLQMAFEKLAKAALLRSSPLEFARKARKSHKAASKMIQVLKRNRDMLSEL